MSVSVWMLALAGFLGGGVYSMAKTGHPFAAVVLGLAAGLSVVAAVAWWGS